MLVIVLIFQVLASFILVLVWARYWLAAMLAGVSVLLAAPAALILSPNAEFAVGASAAVGAVSLAFLSSIVFVRKWFRAKAQARAAKHA